MSKSKKNKKYPASPEASATPTVSDKTNTKSEVQKEAKQSKAAPTAGQRFGRLYIVTAISSAAVCLAIVLITAQTSRSVKLPDQSNTVILPSPVPVDSLLKDLDKLPSVAKTLPPAPTPSAEPVKEAAPQPTVPAPTPKPASGKAQDTVAVFQPSEPFSIQMPIEGEILKTFSRDRLQKSITLDDWRIHNGIDIRASISDPVYAAADGVVEHASFDPMNGYTVVLRHEDGYQTIYSNLASDEMVKQEQKMKAGECLGAVGDSAVAEKLEEVHLHFELTKDGVQQNPSEYTKEN